jgi:carboxypeptidase PM20D1
MKKRKLVMGTFGGLLLLFGAVTGFQALTLESKQPSAKPTAVEIDKKRALQHFSEAITYQTVSYEDRAKFNFSEFDGFIEFLQASYPSSHDELELERINNYALLYKWEGSDSSLNPIGLTSHYDVVPVLDGTAANWEQEPFSGTVTKDAIWGRGTLDDKIGVIGIMEAVEYLVNKGYQPKRDMYFMFGFDEEIGGEEGAKAIAETLKERGILFDFVMDEGGAIVENMVPGVSQPVGVVGISEKGSATVELTIEGSGGHSSQPNNQTNIGRIAMAIAKLEDTQFHAELRGPGEDLFEFVAPSMTPGMKYVFANKAVFKPVIEHILLQEPASAALIRTTIAPTIFQAGEQSNVLPEKASAVINLRLMPGDSLGEVKSFIEKTIDDKHVLVSISGSEATKVSSVDGWEFSTIQQAARNVYGNAIIAPYLMVAGSDAKHYDQVSNNTYRFLPVQITAVDLNRMHGTNEHVSIDNYLNSIKFYVELIKETNK